MNSMPARPAAGAFPPIDEFRFTRWSFDEARGELRCEYEWSDGRRFVETHEFGPAEDPARVDRRALARIAALLHLACGVSYYKAALAPRLVVRDPTSASTLAFFRHLYLRGLGEMAVRNGIDLRDRLNFAAPEAAPAPVAAALPARALVPIGGGKDSLATVEIVKSSGRPFSLFAVNPSRVSLACAQAAGARLVTVKRTLAPELFALNDAGWPNGHIPITAIVSLLACFAATWHGYDEVVMSNERSANVGNLRAFGFEVNHQYSKSLDFEDRFRALLGEDGVSTLAYYSLLRPLSELSIAKRFAGTTVYDGVFTSCNRVFRIRDAQTDRLWCGECPKCQFVFLALAPFAGRERMQRIFGRNLLADRASLPGYLEIAGLEGHKPWECVGEVEEAAAAIALLAREPAWRDDVVVAELSRRLNGKGLDAERVIAEVLAPSPRHNVPTRLAPLLGL